eukprot:8470696-Prorocentrum_lima.AAC.1
MKGALDSYFGRLTSRIIQAEKSRMLTTIAELMEVYEEAYKSELQLNPDMDKEVFVEWMPKERSAYPSGTFKRASLPC